MTREERTTATMEKNSDYQNTAAEYLACAKEHEQLAEWLKELKALKERPQGEWINTSPYDIKGTCSLCCYLSNKCYKFCPNCGADMRGKKNESGNKI